MAIREVDAISDAIIETEKEIAGEAWGNEDTSALDETGDRSLEDIGEGLEGQQEPEDEDETEGEDADGETESEGEDEGEGETEGDKKPLAAEDGKGKPEAKPAEQPEGRVPSGKLREANERARAAEAERDTVKAKIDEVTKTFSDKLDAAMRRIDDLTRAPRTEPPKPATEVKAEEAEPDIFEDPKGFTTGIKRTIQNEVNKVLGVVRHNSVATSFELAHVKHGEAFPKAMEAINRLDANNPDDRAIVQRIYNSPNPGDALVSWHKRNQTLAEVGDDPTAYKERIREETRQTLLKDPEFRKQLIADLRGEAAHGDDGRPRTTTRLPKSLNGAPGSNLGAERSDPRVSDDSEQAVADAAWR